MYRRWRASRCASSIFHPAARRRHGQRDVRVRPPEPCGAPKGPLYSAVAQRTFAACKPGYDIASVECEASRSQPRPAPANLADDVHASRAGATTASRSPGRRRARRRPPKSPIGHEPVLRREFVRRPQGPILTCSPQSQVIAWASLLSRSQQELRQNRLRAIVSY